MTEYVLGSDSEEIARLDALPERLREAIDAADAVVLPPTVAGAWGNT
jgi:hypothetical protein